MKDDKIQTGLRIPQSRYMELKEMADKAGISINAVILFLVDIGLSAINQGFEEAARSGPQNQQQSAGKYTQPDC